MNKTLKKINNIKNKTKKRQETIIQNMNELSNKQRELI